MPKDRDGGRRISCLKGRNKWRKARITFINSPMWGGGRGILSIERELRGLFIGEDYGSCGIGMLVVRVCGLGCGVRLRKVGNGKNARGGQAAFTAT